MMGDQKLEEGTILRVTMEVRLPVAATADQISEWLESEVGQFGGIAQTNALICDSPQAWGYVVGWRDTGFIGREEKSDYEKHADGRETYNIRYVREAKRPAALPPAGGR